MGESIKRLQTKQLIEKAIEALLHERPFDQVTTVAIVERAGISRSSFYTHYRDKYEVIEHYQASIFQQLEYLFNQPTENPQKSIRNIFQFLNEEPLLARLLSQNGTRELQLYLRNQLQRLLMQVLQPRLFPDAGDEYETIYGGVYLTHAFFGVCQLWIERGQQESPDEIATFLWKMLS